ncbi:MAG: cysteine--tRNA ligase [Candidatus Hodarchaeales archaeon]
MTIRFYNSLSREVEEFVPLKPGKARLYHCGPTVYDFPHIGNYRSFFLGDMLRRYLEFRGYEVFQIMNVTDIDDKTIRDSGEANLELEQFTEQYTKEFFRGLDMLNIRRSHVYPRATTHVPEMIELISKLFEKDLAYQKGGDVYYRISSFPNYGRLARIDPESLQIGASVDVDEYDKDNPRDFALWKAAKEDELQRNIFYESPWGKGRPGWHIECSAMGMKYFGETFEIHTGGVDNMFPHHDNEIAQSEGATGKPFVKYWIHGEFLLVDGVKMAKSEGNYFTLEDLFKKYSTDTIRYLFLSTHYRQQLNYTENAIENAKSNVERLRTSLNDLRSEIAAEPAHLGFGENEKGLLDAAKEAHEEFIQKVDDDLNLPGGLSALHKISRAINIYLAQQEKNLGVMLEVFRRYVELFDVLGLFEKETSPRDAGLSEDVMKILIDIRQTARAKKDFAIADEIRSRLDEVGIELKDLPDGTRWSIRQE